MDGLQTKTQLTNFSRRPQIIETGEAAGRFFAGLLPSDLSLVGRFPGLEADEGPHEPLDPTGEISRPGLSLARHLLRR